MQSQESKRYRPATVWPASWRSGAELAFEYYQQREALTVDHKGDDLQDVVSVADKRVEAFVKQRIQSAFPEDGFLGEEKAALACPTRECCGWSTPSMAPAVSSTACTPGACRWRSSPTANRSSAWSTTPTIASCFTPCGAHGAWLNDAPIRPHPATTVKEGVMGVGTSHRVTPADFLPFLQALLSDGGAFIRKRLRGVDERLGG